MANATDSPTRQRRVFQDAMIAQPKPVPALIHDWITQQCGNLSFKLFIPTAPDIRMIGGRDDMRGKTP